MVKETPKAELSPAQKTALMSSERDRFISALSSESESERVDHPAHYHPSTIETVEVIEAWKLGFNLGNVVKYIARAELKGSRREDLLKALWYLERELSKDDS